MNSLSLFIFKLLFFFLGLGIIMGQKSLDSLSSLEFPQLQSRFMEHLKQEDTARIYASYYLTKAKQTKDPIKIADGYHLLFMISTPEVAMKYVDSIIELTKDVNHLNYPSRGYLNKGVLLANADHYNEALDYYLKAKYYAEKNKNDSHSFAATLNMADLKYSLGKKSEALNIYKSNLRIIKEKDIEQKFFVHYIGTLQRLTIFYIEKKIPDSASYYIQEGLKMYENSNQVFGYQSFILNGGITQYLKGNYDSAIESLQKYNDSNTPMNDGSNHSVGFIYLAKCYQKKGDYQSMSEYLEKIVALTEADNHRYNAGTREAYEMLINEYKRKEDTGKQIKLLQKMIVLDSIANAQNIKLNVDMYQKYDSQKLKDQRNQLLSELKQEKNNKYLIFSLFIIVAVSSSYLVYRNHSKKNYYKRRFDELMQSKPMAKETEQVIIKEKTSKELNIQEEVINEILDKLAVFEKKEKFLDRSLTLVKLAKKLQTNSTYLSKVINHTKGQNFANYINDLRIDYVVNRLKDDQIFRKYTLKSISEEVGFNNAQSFSTAFIKKTGIKPSYFLNSIENQSVN